MGRNVHSIGFSDVHIQGAKCASSVWSRVDVFYTSCTRSGPHEVEIVGFLLFCRLFVTMYEQFGSIHEDMISKKPVGYIC